MTSVEQPAKRSLVWAFVEPVGLGPRWCLGRVEGERLVDIVAHVIECGEQVVDCDGVMEACTPRVFAHVLRDDRIPAGWFYVEFASLGRAKNGAEVMVRGGADSCLTRLDLVREVEEETPAGP